MTISALRRSVRRWYVSHARDLPWRRTRSAYAILVSEVMLQQTQADRVVPKYRAFLRRFPTLGALARASLADVLRAWSGLGYNGRARRLWECARAVAEQHKGRLPRDVAALTALPCIGRYTAGAVASIAFGARTPAVDVNIARVLARAIDGVDTVGTARAWELAEIVLPTSASGAWNQALMDVGAAYCRPLPKCSACPIRNTCRTAAAGRHERAPVARRQARYENSRRFFRGRIVKALAAAPSLSYARLGEQVKEGFGETDLPWLDDLLAGLQRDGLVTLDRRRQRARLP